MAQLLHDLITNAAWKRPQALALRWREGSLDYGQLAEGVERAAQAFLSLGLKRGERVAVLLEKRPEALLAMFGALAAGAAFVPLDPQLKDEQAALVLRESGARMLVTTPTRRLALTSALARCPELRCVLQTGAEGAAVPGLAVFGWDDCLRHADPLAAARGLETGMAALVYRCGASGKPCGAMLSHRGLLASAAAIGERLGPHGLRRGLSLLPLSGAPGLALLAGSLAGAAAALLADQVPAREIAELVAREEATSLAAPPWLWMQVAALDWRAGQALRSVISAGGALPRPSLDALRRRLPLAQIWLMHERQCALAQVTLAPYPGAGAEQLANVI